MAVCCEILEVRSLLSGPTSVLGELTGTVTIHGNLDVPGEIDRYTFTLKDDSEVYFDSLTNKNTLNWSLAGPAGNSVPVYRSMGPTGHLSRIPFGIWSPATIRLPSLAVEMHLAPMVSDCSTWKRRPC